VYGQAQAAMGSDWADFNRDGRLDLVVTAFSDEPYSLYENRGQFFENVSTRKGIARPTTKPLGFGAKFLDADNDGWPDIVFANGHVYDGVQRIDPGSTYLQPLMFFRNNRGQNFEEIGAQVGPEFTRPILGRGLATGDYDNDGRIDMLVVDYEGAPLLLHNETAQPGHWLELELTAHGGNRHAYGAVVTLHASTTRWTQTLSPASSYLSSSSPVLHFGLGPVTRLDRIEVRWPDGRKESFATDRVDLRSRIVQGTGRIR